jgi:hypothetical protein
MELRELRGDDLFTILPIIAKLDIKDQLTSLFDGSGVDAETAKKLANKKITKEERNDIAQKQGGKILIGLLQQALMNINKIKGDINDLLADLTGESVEKIKDLPVNEYVSLLIKFFKKPELKEVFTSAVSAMNQTANTD